jgi:3-methyladenine DNA glycosylase Tag
MNHDDETARTIFSLAFMKLRELSIKDNFYNEILERRRRVFDESKPDSFFYEILVRDIFNAGMKASVITSKLPFIKETFADFDIKQVSNYDDSNLSKMLKNPRIIKNKRKLCDCILNAKTMKGLSDEYGSFGKYLGKYLSSHSDNLQDLALELAHRFSSVGYTLALNYLKDVGMDTIKPDVHVLRVLYRLGFLDSEKSSEQNIQKTIRVAEKMKAFPYEELSVIDAVFWMYGGAGDGHVKKAMCNKNRPFCGECPLTAYCSYYCRADLKEPT